MTSPTNISSFSSLPSFLSSSLTRPIQSFVSRYLSSLLFHLSLSYLSSVLFSSSSLLWAVISVSLLITPQLNCFILRFTFPLSLFHLSFSLCSSFHPPPLFSPHAFSHHLSTFFHFFLTSCFFSASLLLRLLSFSLLPPFLNFPVHSALPSLSSTSPLLPLLPFQHPFTSSSAPPRLSILLFHC